MAPINIKQLYDSFCQRKHSLSTFEPPENLNKIIFNHNESDAEYCMSLPLIISEFEESALTVLLASFKNRLINTKEFPTLSAAPFCGVHYSIYVSSISHSFNFPHIPDPDLTGREHSSYFYPMTKGDNIDNELDNKNNIQHEHAFNKEIISVTKLWQTLDKSKIDCEHLEKAKFTSILHFHNWREKLLFLVLLLYNSSNDEYYINSQPVSPSLHKIINHLHPKPEWYRSPSNYYQTNYFEIIKNMQLDPFACFITRNTKSLCNGFILPWCISKETNVSTMTDEFKRKFLGIFCYVVLLLKRIQKLTNSLRVYEHEKNYSYLYQTMEQFKLNDLPTSIICFNNAQNKTKQLLKYRQLLMIQLTSKLPLLDIYSKREEELQKTLSAFRHIHPTFILNGKWLFPFFASNYYLNEKLIELLINNNHLHILTQYSNQICKNELIGLSFSHLQLSQAFQHLPFYSINQHNIFETFYIQDSNNCSLSENEYQLLILTSPASFYSSTCIKLFRLLNQQSGYIKNDNNNLTVWNFYFSTQFSGLILSFLMAITDSSCIYKLPCIDLNLCPKQDIYNIKIIGWIMYILNILFWNDQPNQINSDLIEIKPSLHYSRLNELYVIFQFIHEHYEDLLSNKYETHINYIQSFYMISCFSYLELFDISYGFIQKYNTSMKLVLNEYINELRILSDQPIIDLADNINIYNNNESHTSVSTEINQLDEIIRKSTASLSAFFPFGKEKTKEKFNENDKRFENQRINFIHDNPNENIPGIKNYDVNKINSWIRTLYELITLFNGMKHQYQCKSIDHLLKLLSYTMKSFILNLKIQTEAFDCIFNQLDSINKHSNDDTYESSKYPTYSFMKNFENHLNIKNNFIIHLITILFKPRFLTENYQIYYNNKQPFNLYKIPDVGFSFSDEKTYSLSHTWFSTRSFESHSFMNLFTQERILNVWNNMNYTTKKRFDDTIPLIFNQMQTIEFDKNKPMANFAQPVNLNEDTINSLSSNNENIKKRSRYSSILKRRHQEIENTLNDNVKKNKKKSKSDSRDFIIYFNNDDDNDNEDEDDENKENYEQQ